MIIILRFSYLKKALFGAIFFLLYGLHGFCCAHANERYWLQIMPKNELWIRYLDTKPDSKDQCPTITADGKPYKMNVYKAKDDKFPTSCKLAFKVNKLPKSAVLDDKKININLKLQDIKKIAVIGDTGCRVHKFINQDCKNDWYFKQIADAVLLHKPDIILHVGDYIYREHGYQDKWQVWKEDFFDPADSILKSGIPWIMVRGNHEDCKRNGNGWFALLSDKPENCHNHSQIYSVKINDIDLLVTDSTLEEDLLADLKKINSDLVQKKTWITTHRPVVGVGKNGELIGYKKILSDLDDKVKMIISGHVHALQVIKHNQIVQLIAGNSGTLLSYEVAKNISKQDANSVMEYGFTMIEFLGDRVSLSSYNKDGAKILQDQYLDCPCK